jgi:hypothetical protein
MNCQLGSYFSKNGIERAMDIYNFPEGYNNRTRTLAIQYLLQFRIKGSPSKEIIKTYILNWFNILKNNNDNNDILYELTDITLQHHFLKDGNDMLNIIRNRDLTNNNTSLELTPMINKINQIRDTKNIKDTVYGDKQNVHNSKINKSVLEAAVQLNKKAISYLNGKKFPTWNQLIQEMKNIYKNDLNFVKKPLDRIFIDVGTYNIHKNLSTILISLWVWIKYQKNPYSLYQRLYQELLESTNLCGSGHMSRLINVIQGFTDDPLLQIKITDKDQCYAVVKNYINNLLEKNEDMLDNMINQNQEFIDFITIKINDQKNEWNKIYGDEFSKYINEVVNKHTYQQIFLPTYL